MAPVLCRYSLRFLALVALVKSLGVMKMSSPSFLRWRVAL